MLPKLHRCCPVDIKIVVTVCDKQYVDHKYHNYRIQDYKNDQSHHNNPTDRYGKPLETVRWQRQLNYNTSFSLTGCADVNYEDGGRGNLLIN